MGRILFTPRSRCIRRDENLKYNEWRKIKEGLCCGSSLLWCSVCAYEILHCWRGRNRKKIRLKRKSILKVAFLNVRNQIYKKKKPVVSTVRGFCTRSNSRFLWLKIKLPYLSFSAISKHLLLYFVPQKEGAWKEGKNNADEWDRSSLTFPLTFLEKSS